MWEDGIREREQYEYREQTAIQRAMDRNCSWLSMRLGMGVTEGLLVGSCCRDGGPETRGVHHHATQNGIEKPRTGPLRGGTHGFVSPLLRQLCTWDFLLFQNPRCQARGGTRVQKLLPRTLWAACSSAAALPCPLKLGGKQMIVIICSLMFFDLPLQLKSILVVEGCVKLSAPQTFLTWSWAGFGPVVKDSALQLKLETKGFNFLMKQQAPQLKL